MNLDIKSIQIKPKRNTFGHIERRIGADKMATRYEEATYDIQPTTNFHYLPLYNSKYEIYDERKTAIKMGDWYKFLDPRQYYYGSYVNTRAKQQETTDQNFSFIEKRNLLSTMSADIKNQILTSLLPIRHFEWGANMNNLQLVSECYGAAFGSAAMFYAEDRLGNAQLITRIGLALSENDPSVIDEAKEIWLKDASWQPLRKAMEDSFIVEDWFELFVAQNVVMDSFIHSLFFDAYEQELRNKGENVQSMMTEFLTNWHEETIKWIDKTVQVGASESDENKQLITTWVKKYIDIAQDAVLPLAKNLVSDPNETIANIKQNLIDRLNKNSLSL